MADESYPSTLPGVLLATYANEEFEHFESNDVQSGPPRVELRTSVTPVLFNVTWYYSPFDFQLFEGWFKENITFGSEPFDISLPVGAGDLDHECFFRRRYKATRRSQRWIVTAQLIATEKRYNTSEDIAALFIIAEMTDATFQSDFFDAFNIFADTDLPNAWENIEYGTDFS